MVKGCYTLEVICKRRTIDGDLFWMNTSPQSQIGARRARIYANDTLQIVDLGEP